MIKWFRKWFSPDLPVPPLSEMVKKTLHARREVIISDMLTHNALLRHLPDGKKPNKHE